jgi:IS5 family transposase
LHTKTTQGDPFDGHTLGPVIGDLENRIGIGIRRIQVDRDYRGHNYPNRFKVWITGQVRCVGKRSAAR